MSTIAVKDGIIAYDSRTTRGRTILDDDADKKHEKNGVYFFMVGAVCDYPKLIEAFFDPNIKVFELEASAFVVENEKLFTIGVDEKRGLWKTLENPIKPNAMGSGEEHAITAMDCGLTAAEAVEMAKKRDSSTGGKVRTYKIKNNENNENNENNWLI